MEQWLSSRDWLKPTDKPGTAKPVVMDEYIGSVYNIPRCRPSTTQSAVARKAARVVRSETPSTFRVANAGASGPVPVSRQRCHEMLQRSQNECADLQMELRNLRLPQPLTREAALRHVVLGPLVLQLDEGHSGQLRITAAENTELKREMSLMKMMVSELQPRIDATKRENSQALHRMQAQHNRALEEKDEIIRLEQERRMELSQRIVELELQHVQSNKSGNGAFT
jgi:hypothetical protein